MDDHDTAVLPGWTQQKRPPAWNKRFDFADYAQTRGFLDGLTALSETSGYYPNLNFARTHVVVTISFDGDEAGPRLRDFAREADACAQRIRG
ncbi:4a-hydroxytetrahydrobiopterin dehydratase [Acidiferrobacter sp.]|uniref:4a-hydroxytetrahydrobiopterin dehydratase n=1 Tax=Acidiferrobacter sp. TaxID=1872107 RepID=UPI00261C7998|nr:4a-hydroxytetrahydrobiopterin dehydratase [Acidiferrobacter sp.]